MSKSLTRGSALFSFKEKEKKMLLKKQKEFISRKNIVWDAYSIVVDCSHLYCFANVPEYLCFHLIITLWSNPGVIKTDCKILWRSPGFNGITSKVPVSIDGQVHCPGAWTSTGHGRMWQRWGIKGCVLPQNSAVARAWDWTWELCLNMHSKNECHCYPFRVETCSFFSDQ